MTAPGVAAHLLASIDVGEMRPKETSQTGDQFEASMRIWTTERSGTVKVGVYECTEGKFATRRDGFSEICHFISGRATITSDDGQAIEVQAGDAVVLPDGWSGTWDVHERLRKFFVVQTYG